MSTEFSASFTPGIVVSRPLSVSLNNLAVRLPRWGLMNEYLRIVNCKRVVSGRFVAAAAAVEIIMGDHVSIWKMLAGRGGRMMRAIKVLLMVLGGRNKLNA